jgi:hypothetical protein
LRLALLLSFWFYFERPPFGGSRVSDRTAEEGPDHGEEVVRENDQEAEQSRCAESSPAGDRPESGRKGETRGSREGAERNERSTGNQSWQISTVRSTMVEAVPAALTHPT